MGHSRHAFGGQLHRLLLVSVAAVACSSPPQSVSDPSRVLASTHAYVGVSPGAWVKGVGISHYVGAWGSDPTGTQTQLDVIPGVDTGAPKTLTTTATASLNSVQMAPVGSDPNKYVDVMVYADSVDPQTGLGTLMFVDLSKPLPKAIPVPQGSKAFPQSILFGKQGDQILYISQNSTDQGMVGAKLFFWDGKVDAKGNPTDPTPLNPDPKDLAAPSVMIQSVDRSKVLVATNFSFSTGMGDLQIVDMTDGSIHLVDQGVVLFASALEKVTGNMFLSSTLLPAFSYTPDLSSVAYSKPSMDTGTMQTTFTVSVWSASDGVKQVLENAGDSMPPSGIFPGISPSGQLVAFWDYSINGEADDGHVLLRVWQKSSGAELFHVQVRQSDTPVLCPRISPDDSFIAYLTKFVERGNGFYGGDLGSLTLLPVNIDQSKGVPPEAYAFPLGDAVAWQSVAFQPEFRADVSPQFTRQITFMANFKDLTQTVTLSSTLGDLYVGDLTTGTPPLGLDKPIDTRISPGDLLLLPTTNGVLYSKGGVATNSDDPHVFLWTAGMSVPRQLDVGGNNAAEGAVIRGSLRVFPITKELEPQPGDAILFMTSAIPGASWTPDATSGSTYPEAWIRATKVVTGGETPFLVENRPTFFQATFSTNGRVLGIYDGRKAPATAATPAAAAAKPTSVIRDMPLPTSNPPDGPPPT